MKNIEEIRFFFIVLVVTLSGCASKRLNAGVDLSLVNDIKEHLNEEFELKSQADGVFVFYVELEVLKGKAMLIDINSKHDFKTIKESFKRTLNVFNVSNAIKDGKYYFMIRLNTIQYGIEVFNYTKNNTP